jgi:hypothetical protein
MKALINFRVEPEVRSAIDMWRRLQPDSIPTLSSAINRLVQRGLEAEATQRKSKKAEATAA